jgi:hypothetical protein
VEARGKWAMNTNSKHSWTLAPLLGAWRCRQAVVVSLRVRFVLTVLTLMFVVSGRGVAQIRSLGGSFTFTGGYTIASAGPSSVGSRYVNGVFGLGGEAYLFHPALASFGFRFNIAQGLSSADNETGGARSWNRNIDWYNVYGSILQAQPVSFTLGASLSAVDLTSSSSSFTAAAVTGAYAADFQRNSGTVAIGLGNMGQLSGGVDYGTTHEHGVVRDTVLRSRQFNAGYTVAGDNNESMSLLLSRSESDGGSNTGILWTNSASFGYGGPAGNSSLGASAQYTQQPAGQDIRAGLSLSTQLSERWRLSRGLSGGLYNIGQYLRGSMMYNNQYVYWTDNGLTASAGAAVGYAGTYVEATPGMGVLTSGVNGGGNGSMQYSYELDSIGSMRAQSSVSAGAQIIGADMQAVTQASASQNVQWQLNDGTYVSGTMSGGKTFGYLGPTSFGQTLGVGTSIWQTSVSASAGHSWNFSPYVDFTGKGTRVNESFYASEHASGYLPALRTGVDVNANQRFAQWTLVQMDAVLALRSLLVPGLLDGRLSYSFAYLPQQAVNTHRLSAFATLTWRAVYVTASVSLVRVSGVTFTNASVTFSRPWSFSII